MINIIGRIIEEDEYTMVLSKKFNGDKDVKVIDEIVENLLEKTCESEGVNLSNKHFAFLISTFLVDNYTIKNIETQRKVKGLEKDINEYPSVILNTFFALEYTEDSILKLTVEGPGTTIDINSDGFVKISDTDEIRLLGQTDLIPMTLNESVGL